jgi:hypothetical protein
VDAVVHPLDVSAADDRDVERWSEGDAVEPVERRRARPRHEGIGTAVEHELAEVAERRSIDHRIAERVHAGLDEDAALDSASKLTGGDPGVPDLGRRDRAVLTCRVLRQPAELIGHGPDSSTGGRLNRQWLGRGAPRS